MTEYLLCMFVDHRGHFGAFGRTTVCLSHPIAEFLLKGFDHVALIPNGLGDGHRNCVHSELFRDFVMGE